ncbi:MAG: molybdate ABC transporter substrate-binding protein [Magnetococcales bacterium]|nr:molybdate ABC transporter substrate-binding protein [Magnetococcales bacterium]
MASLVPTGGHADEVRVAVAANFRRTFQDLAARFQTDQDHQVVTSYASTGKLYAQIHAGAPFHLFLAADTERPERLFGAGLAVDAGQVYALGRLVLWSRDPTRLTGHGDLAAYTTSLRRLAMANPETAPYGRATREALRKTNLWSTLSGRMVFGEDVGQTLAFVASGNAEVGFVALSQVQTMAREGTPGSWWELPRDIYPPIAQKMVLLKNGAAQPAARKLMEFLVSAPARALIAQGGYDLP